MYAEPPDQRLPTHKSRFSDRLAEGPAEVHFCQCHCSRNLCIQARVWEKPCVYYYLNPTQKRTSRRFVLPVAFTPEPSIIDFVWAPTQLRGKDVRLIFPFEWLRECFKFYRSEFLGERISHALFYCRFQILLFRDLPRAIQPFTGRSGCSDA